MITGRTVLYGVMGHPVAHTLSPAMHNAAFDALRMDAAFLPLPVAPEDLAVAIAGAHALGFQGLSITVPHKEKAAALCAAVDRGAQEVGAVNCLRRSGDAWEGFNTDAPACAALLEIAGVSAGSTAVVLGAGGAARATLWALRQLGAIARVAARRDEAALALCRAFARPGFEPTALPWSDAGPGCEAAQVVVNATSIGLSSDHGMPAFAFRPSQAALDWVYGETAFARDAEEAGATVIRGEQLLLRQGTLAFTLWTGRAAPEAVMAVALKKQRR